MADVRLTADLHLGHPKVARERGFASVAAHDDAVLGNLAKGASERTLLWVLGDVVFGPDKAGLLRRLRDEVPGRKRLVLGNHDKLHPAVAPNADWGAWSDVFEQVHTMAQVKHDGKVLLLSHFPYDGDHTDESRFDQWRLRDMGDALAHGHTHASQRTSRSANGTVQVHVGLDAWRLRPAALHDVCTIAWAD